MSVRGSSLPKDPAFPLLASAGDPDFMLASFRKGLRPVNGEDLRIEGCRLRRIRYRRGERCILQYALRVSGSETKQTVSGTLYAESGKSERLWRKLESEASRGVPESAPTFEPVAFLEDLGMLVQVFPFDRRIPALPALASGPPPEMEPSMLERFGPGEWRSERCSVEPVRYREHLGATLRYDVLARSSGSVRSGRFYVKAYRDDGGGRTLRTLRNLSTARGEHYRLVEPVSYLGEYRALLLEEAPGISLEAVLLGGRGLAEAARRVGRAVAEFNETAALPERRYTVEEYVASLRRAGRLVGWVRPELGPRVEEIVRAVEANLEEVSPAATHRDLKPDHVFLDADRALFIDLDGSAAADPVLDPALLLARLAAAPCHPPVSRRRARAAAGAFAAEYFARVPSAWRERLRFHYAGALLEVAQGLFRRQERDWPVHVERLVREAADSLHDGASW